MTLTDCPESLRAKLDLPVYNSNLLAAFEETPLSLRQKLGVQASVTSIPTRHELSKERLEAAMPEIRHLASFYRAYPDIFLDLFKDSDVFFELAPYQRIFLRNIMRNRYIFATFPRGYSKSFLAILANYLKCILYPNSKVFLTSPGKQQSMSIIQQKIKEIWDIYPGLRAEVLEGRDAESSKMQSNIFSLKFKNGSVFDVISSTERSRGLRYTSGIIEEAAKIDGVVLSDVIIPTMNIARRAANGREDPNDLTNKSQCYITSAGLTETFAYDKLTTLFLWSILRPQEAICFGGTWRMPVLYHLLDENFVEDLKNDGTYSDATFQREYESQWTGNSSASFFSADEFDHCRTVSQALTEAPEKMPRRAQIILAYDVGRNNDLSSCVVIYLEPQPNGTFLKKIVNIFALEHMHYALQATEIKKMLIRYNASKLIIDGNGLGIGLVDFLTVKNKDPNTGTELPAFGVDAESDPTNMYQNFYKGSEQLYDNKIWIMKANDRLNSEMHNLISAQISTSKVRFLIDEQTARENLQKSRYWADYTEEQKVAAIRPYVMTRLLKEEMMNLRRQSDDSANITLKKISSRLKKDKFSALEYGIWYCRKLEVAKETDMSVDVSLISKNKNVRKNYASCRRTFTRTKSFGGRR